MIVRLATLLFYAGATFLLCQLAAAAMAPLIAGDPARWGWTDGLTEALMALGPITFLILAVAELSPPRDGSRHTQEPGSRPGSTR